MRTVDIIAKKRNGEELISDEIESLIAGYTRGDIPDYQMAAWLMAVCWRGMTEAETTELTMSMARSGKLLNLHIEAGIPDDVIVVDKHSTGGVGDKTTLVVAPLVAALGLPVAKMSGRGLGFSGGTLDKLETFKGYDSSLSLKQFMEQLRRIGIVVAGQNADLAPADGKMYALRDVTATVESIPLIAGSVMSKKIASGADAIVLDVKVGAGAFMKTLPEAEELAHRMVAIGDGVGRNVVAMLSDMSQPLGLAVGNALEVLEALATLRGEGTQDFTEHCLLIAGEMLVVGRIVPDTATARKMLHEAIANGAGLKKLHDLVRAQGGDADLVEHPERITVAPVHLPVESPHDGYIAALDAQEVGLIAVQLGAGRERKDAQIDLGVGIVFDPNGKVGGYRRQGQPLATIYANEPGIAEVARARLLDAYRWSETPVQPPPLVYEIVR